MSSTNYSDSEAPIGLTQRRRFSFLSKLSSFSLISSKVRKNNYSAAPAVVSAAEPASIWKSDNKNMNDNMNGYVSTVSSSSSKVESKLQDSSTFRCEKQTEGTSKYNKFDLKPDEEVILDQPMIPPIIAASSHGHSKTISHKDRNSMIVLLVLYTLQGKAVIVMSW